VREREREKHIEPNEVFDLILLKGKSGEMEKKFYFAKET